VHLIVTRRLGLSPGRFGAPRERPNAVKDAGSGAPRLRHRPGGCRRRPRASARNGRGRHRERIASVQALRLRSVAPIGRSPDSRGDHPLGARGTAAAAAPSHNEQSRDREDASLRHGRCDGAGGRRVRSNMAAQPGTCRGVPIFRPGVPPASPRRATLRQCPAGRPSAFGHAAMTARASEACLLPACKALATDGGSDRRPVRHRTPARPPTMTHGLFTCPN
jgi:hypothetical protein